MGEPLRWTRGRFPHWFSADARGESSPLNRGERDELNALPYARYWWNEPIVPRRAWSAGVYNDVPQLWKWDAAGQVPPATLRDQYAGETRPESEASVRPAKPQPEPASKITLNVPILRRALPGVSAVRVVDIPNTAGRTDRSLIVDTDRGTLWLRWLGNDGYGQTRWITSQERKQLEARSKPDVYAVSAPIPETVPPITGATAPNTPSDLRPLCLWSDGSGYHAAVGSPFPWYDDRSKKQWTQKAAFPASVQRYLRTASDLQKMPVSRMGQYFVVGSDAGLWTHSDGRLWVR